MTNEVHDELRGELRSLLQRHCTIDDVTAAVGSADGFDRNLWRLMAEQMGVAALALPEAYGGDGFGPAEINLVSHELGRSLAPSPYLGSVVLAGTMLSLSADVDLQSRLLPQIANGERIAAVAVAEPGAGWDLNKIAARAERTSDGWTVSGAKQFVLDADVAGELLVVARHDRQLMLFAVSPESPGVQITTTPGLDTTRRLCAVDLFDAPAIVVSGDDDQSTLLRLAMDTALLAVAAEQVGCAERALEMTVEYARTREQFDRPIGSFQSYKHRCADMYAGLELSRSSVDVALAAFDNDPQERSALCAMAHYYASQTACRITAEAIQLHGGIGYTWEYPAHLYLKRAKASSFLFGNPVSHRRQLAAALSLAT